MGKVFQPLLSRMLRYEEKDRPTFAAIYQEVSEAFEAQRLWLLDIIEIRPVFRIN